MSRFAVVAFCLVASGTSIPSGPDYEAGPVDARVVSGPDEDGELLISLKAMVTNYSDGELTVSLSIQGCDDEGFELAEFELEGKVRSKTTKVITDTDYVEADVFKSISSWNIEEVEVSKSDGA